MPKLESLLAKQFPNAKVDFIGDDYGINSVEDWDSLGHFNLLMLIENEYGFQFTDDEMAEIKNKADIRRALNQRGIDS